MKGFNTGDGYVGLVDGKYILFASESITMNSIKMIRIYFAVAGMMGLQYACQNTFLALGNATVSIFLALLRKVILPLPLIFILPHVLP